MELENEDNNGIQKSKVLKQTMLAIVNSIGCKSSRIRILWRYTDQHRSECDRLQMKELFEQYQNAHGAWYAEDFKPEWQDVIIAEVKLSAGFVEQGKPLTMTFCVRK